MCKYRFKVRSFRELFSSFKKFSLTETTCEVQLLFCVQGCNLGINLRKVFVCCRLFNVWDNGVTLGEFLLIPAILIGFGVWGGLSCCDAESTGSVANMAIFLTFILSSKNSFITFLLGVSYERVLVLHKFMAVVAVATTILHGVASEVNGSEEDGEGQSTFSFFSMEIVGFSDRRGNWYFSQYFSRHLPLFDTVKCVNQLFESKNLNCQIFLLDNSAKIIRLLNTQPSCEVAK